LVVTGFRKLAAVARLAVSWWLSCLAAATVFAADGGSADLADLSMEELSQIEVRVASRIPTDLLNAASSVEVIPEGTWRRRGAESVSDVLAMVPGISISPSLSGGDAFTIRGYTRSSSVVGVLYSWDGVPLNDLFRGAPTLMLPGLNLGTLDEIQLIEGPGSAQYGSDAFHGVVALNAFDAAGSTRELTGRGGTDGGYAASARLAGDVSESIHASLALAADGQPDRDLDFDYTDPLTGAPRAGERANRYGAGSASLKLRGEGAGVQWRGGMLIHHYDGDEFQGFGTRLAGVRDRGGIDSDFFLADAGVRREFGGDRAVELSGYAWRADAVLGALRETFDFESVSAQQRHGARASYTDAIAAWNTQWVVGADLEHLRIDEARTRTFEPDGTLLADVANPAEGASRRIWSATFEGNTHWADERWRLVYGVRFDHYSDFGGEWSPRIGLIWHPWQSGSIKFLYGNAFRAPTANELRGTPGLIEQNENLKPELIDTFELVLQHQAADWYTQLTLFHSRWRDGITSVANTAGPLPFVFANLEENRANGVTWDLHWRRDAWFADLGLAWTDSENRTLELDYEAFPRWTLDAELGYEHAPWRTRFSLIQHWQIDTEDVFPPSAGIPATELPHYVRFDLAAVHAVSDRLELGLFVRNLFDRDNVRPSAAGSRGGIPEDSISASAELRVRF